MEKKTNELEELPPEAEAEEIDGIRITVDVKSRHDYSVTVAGTRFPPLAGIEEALTFAMRRTLEYQHEMQQAAKKVSLEAKPRAKEAK